MEKRRNRRFELFLPLQILGNPAGLATPAATTRNISSGGVLFATDTLLEPGGLIEYIVTLSQSNGTKIELRCAGKVVRHHEPADTAEPSPHLIAATLDRYEFVRTGD